MENGVFHKIAVLCKDYYTNRTIDDLFIFAGAAPDWWEPLEQRLGSDRVSNVYAWRKAVETHAPDRSEKILAGVAVQLAEDDRVPEGDRNFLRRSVDGVLSDGGEEAPEGQTIQLPATVEELLQRVIKGIPRATVPLQRRRQGYVVFDFRTEYDYQSLFHALIRPWIRDIRPEEYTPSYAGKSTRMDFLLPAYKIVVELKYVRDAAHAKVVGDELIIDIAHYTAHPECGQLWIIICDPQGYIANADALEGDLSGEHRRDGRGIRVRCTVVSPH